MNDLKNTIIVGGTSGLGMAAARELAPISNLCLVYFSNHEKAKQSKRELEDICPGDVHIMPYELIDNQSVNLCMDRCFELLDNKCDILINCSGRLRDNIAIALSDEVIQLTLNEHLLVPILISKKVSKIMMKQKYGRIVNISSISGFYHKKGQSVYAAAKAGIVAFSKNLAMEVGKKGITVNCVSPGLFETDLTRDFIKTNFSDSSDINKRIPVGQIGRTESFGKLIKFIVDESSFYITGENFVIDGGRSLGDPT